VAENLSMTRVIVALFLLLECVLCNCEAQSREADDLRMADNTIVERLALLGMSPYICTEQPAACISADGIELGTALIAARNAPASLRELARLHRFSLDGGYAETYGQMLCEKSRSIEKYVSALDPEDLRKQCVGEVEAATKSTPLLKQAKVDHICASAKRIRSNIDETLRMVKNPPKSCEPRIPPVMP
jgi:hypothetical protein